MDKTVFVTLTDSTYFPKAKKTIEELRQRGQWDGDVVLMVVDFVPKQEDLPMNTLLLNVQHIDHTPLWNTWKTNPIRKMDDNRHYGKIYQWDKLYIFCDFFQQWDRVVFLDAGIRILDTVQHLLDIPYKGKFLSPDDSDPYDNGNRMRIQFDLDANAKVIQALLEDFGVDWFSSKYFLNCIFLFDTSLLHKNTFEEMKEMMFKYPISLCNEMGIMNLYWTVKRKVWEAFPKRTLDDSKYLFGWSELNYRERPNWQQFCFLKYSASF
jgi:alpha-N-acetylglucosamine transferase